MNSLKIIPFVLLIAVVAVSTSCKDDEPIKVTGIEISSTPSPLVLTVGGATGKLEVAFTPSDASDKSIKWSVEPEGVVTVDGNGIVTAVGPGTATITATAEGNLTETCDVTVNTLLADAQVEFAIAESGAVADMKMLQVSFATGMPTMDITVPGITLTVTDGGYSVSGEGIIPTTVMGGRPVLVEGYPITGLSGTVTARNLTFEMMCGAYPLKYSGTRQADSGAFTGNLTVAPKVE